MSEFSFDSPSGNRWQGATRGFVSCGAGVKGQLVKISNKTTAKTCLLVFPRQQRRCRRRLCCELRAPQLPANEAQRRRAGCSYPARCVEPSPIAPDITAKPDPRPFLWILSLGPCKESIGCRPRPANLMLRFQETNSTTRPPAVGTPHYPTRGYTGDNLCYRLQNIATPNKSVANQTYMLHIQMFFFNTVPSCGMSA